MTLRLAIINEYFHPDNTGGTGTVLSQVARTLYDNFPGTQIDVITTQHMYRQAGSRLARLAEWQGIRITRLATPKATGLPTPIRLLAEMHFSIGLLLCLLRRRYDVLLIGTAPPTAVFAAEMFKRLTGTPYVYIIYDLEPDRAVTLKLLPQEHPAARLFRHKQRRWLHNAGRTIALGRCMRDYLQRTYDLPEERIDVIPIGADPNDIVPLSRQSRFRRMHGLTGFIALYSGNFGRYNNFDTILEAAKCLQASDPSVTFVLVGSGVQKEQVTQRVAAEKIENVKIFDFVEKADYADLLASADVALVTLETGMEGLCVPSKFYSILASGRATVALLSPDAEVAQVVREAECGIRVDQGDSRKLVEVLEFLAAHPEEVERMGDNARRVLIEKYAKDRIAAQYYSSLLSVAVAKQPLRREGSQLPGALEYHRPAFTEPLEESESFVLPRK